MSTVLDPPATSPTAAALDAVSAGLDAVTDADLLRLGEHDLLELTVQMHRLQCRAEAAVHRLVREVDARGAAVAVGAPSTAAWLRHRLRMHPGAARRTVATARSLHADRVGPLVPAADDEPGGRPALAEAFQTGDISAEHAGVACQVLDDLPAGVGSDIAARAEAYLAQQARVHDPKALAHLGRHLRHVLDPDAGDALAAAEEHQVATRTFTVRQRPDGSGDVRGHLDAELTASLLGQVLSLGAPRPAADGTPDPRSAAQRHADALADILRLAASSGRLPTRHGTRPNVTVTIDLQTLRRHLGSDAARIDWAGPSAAETARRLACDARIIPVVLGAAGEPLDVGRASYPVTQGIWRALVARDQGCAFAGCDRPPEWTEAHHRLHWADGGTTSVQNCCLLCDHHHRSVHHHGWQLDLVDGEILTIPPPWIDPTGAPRRQTRRAQLAALATVTRTSSDDLSS